MDVIFWHRSVIILQCHRILQQELIIKRNYRKYFLHSPALIELRVILVLLVDRDSSMTSSSFLITGWLYI